MKRTGGALTFWEFGAGGSVGMVGVQANGEGRCACSKFGTRCLMRALSELCNGARSRWPI